MLKLQDKILALMIFVLGLVFLFTGTVIPASASNYPNNDIGRKINNHSFPRLVNYYLEPYLEKSDYEKLSRNDVVILDMEYQNTQPELFKYLRSKNPDIIILAYVASQYVYQVEDSNNDSLRNDINDGTKPEWYLFDTDREHISIWSATEMMDVTSEWKKYLPQFVSDKIISSGLWDGVFFDGVWENISWLNNGDIDLDNNRVADDLGQADWEWKNNVINLLENMRSLVDENTLILANSHNYFAKYLDGGMFENFLDWKSWTHEILSYQDIFLNDNIAVLNSNTSDTGKKDDYQKMRFGLTSALLFDGYYSFDFGPNQHGQIWWYDEYNIDLGNPLGEPHKINGASDTVFLDTFENGLENYKFFQGGDKNNFSVSLIDNSIHAQSSSHTEKWNEFLHSDLNKITFEKNKTYQISFKYKVLEKSKSGYFYFGARNKNNQSVRFATWNNGEGELIKYFTPESKDYYLYFGIKYDGSIIIDDIEVKKVEPDIYRRDFENGIILVNPTGQDQLIELDNNYWRLKGEQAPKHNTGLLVNKVLLHPQDGIILLKNRMKILIDPYSQPEWRTRVFDFEGNLMDKIYHQVGYTTEFISDLNGDGWDEKINVIKSNGFDAIQITNLEGKLLTPIIYPYGKFSGDINIDIGDVDLDNQKELVVGRINGKSDILVLDHNGQIENKFYSYGDKFNWGVNVAVGDVNGDGKNEIVTSPDYGTIHVKIFNNKGNEYGSFFAYEEDFYRKGAKVKLD